MSAIKTSVIEQKIEQGFLWVRSNPERFWTIVGVIGLAAVFTVFVVQQRQTLRDNAWNDLGLIQGNLMQNQWDKTRQGLEEWNKKYSGTSAASYAKFMQADLLYKTSDYASAAQVYGDLNASAQPDVMQPLALSAQISALEMAGKIPEARAAAQRFIEKYPDHFFAASAYLAQARLAERANDPAAATAIYERFVILYPQSPWTVSVRARLQSTAPSPASSAK